MEVVLSPRQYRKFGFLVGGIIVGIWGCIPLFSRSSSSLWPWIVGSLLILPAWVHPPFLKPFYKGWMRMGMVLGAVNSRIILTLTFYGLFTPVAILFRILGKDPLRRKFDKSANSYRILRKDEDNLTSRMEGPY